MKSTAHAPAQPPKALMGAQMLSPLTMTPPKLYRPVEVQKLLDMPASTLRRYAATLEPHLSEHVARRPRSFTEEDIQIIQQAKEEVGKGVALKDVVPDLPIVEHPATEEESTSLVAGAHAAIAAYNDLRGQLEEIADLMRAQADRIEQLEKDNKEMRDYLAQPWYKRVFGKAPE